MGPWPAASVVLAGLLAGCSVMPQPGGDDAMPSRLSGLNPEGDRTPFPSLGAMPDEPPPVSTPEERRALAEKLELDRLESDRLESGRTKADPAGAPMPLPPTDRLD